MELCILIVVAAAGGFFLFKKNMDSKAEWLFENISLLCLDVIKETIEEQSPDHDIDFSAILTDDSSQSKEIIQNGAMKIALKKFYGDEAVNAHHLRRRQEFELRFASVYAEILSRKDPTILSVISEKVVSVSSTVSGKYRYYSDEAKKWAMFVGYTAVYAALFARGLNQMNANQKACNCIDKLAAKVAAAREYPG